MEKNSYDFFAIDYHNKRRYHWKALDIFLNELGEKEFNFRGYNLDLGCANGRNFDLFLPDSSKLIGLDNSIEFLKLARERLGYQNLKLAINPKSVDLILSDIKAIPLRPNAINNIFSIATIHHVETKKHRSEVLSQLHIILKTHGFLVLSVWRRYQKKYRINFVIDKLKRIFIPTYLDQERELGLLEYGDKFIPWTVSSKNFTCNRFYHFFSLNELKNLLKSFSIKVISKRGGPTKKDNFFVLTQKIDNE
ncbi:MAG: class I SAM-dependent methyltransferase [Promethearchaeota archaeon]|jgi:SAM-dependent methyltransferase